MAQLHAWLATVEGRYCLGWPWYDGARWYIAEAALEAATRPAFMATLPVEEPAAHVVRLPAWCARWPTMPLAG